MSEIRTDHGFIHWRSGTAGNVEITNLEVTGDKREGYGRGLLYLMLQEIRDSSPPSIYGFTAKDNYEAHGFYKAMGFELHVTPIVGVLGSVLFGQSYELLVEKMDEFLGD